MQYIRSFPPPYWRPFIRSLETRRDVDPLIRSLGDPPWCGDMDPLIRSLGTCRDVVTWTHLSAAWGRAVTGWHGPIYHGFLSTCIFSLKEDGWDCKIAVGPMKLHARTCTGMINLSYAVYSCHCFGRTCFPELPGGTERHIFWNTFTARTCIPGYTKSRDYLGTNFAVLRTLQFTFTPSTTMPCDCGGELQGSY
jgi:hypothetical protein